MIAAGRYAWVAVCAILLVLSSACTANHDDIEGQMAACLADAGHDASLEYIDQRRQEDPSFNRAFEECAEAHDVAFLPPGEETRRVDEFVLSIFTCLTDAGWEIPKPERGANGTLVMDNTDDIPEHRLAAFETDHNRCLESVPSHQPPDHEDDQHEHSQHDH